MSSLRIYENKTILYDSRVDMTISCQMDLSNYPFDSHQCLLRMSSYYSSEETVNCTSDYHFDKGRQRSLQHLIDIVPLPSNYRTFMYFGLGYTTCGVNIILVRRRTQIFFQVYLTSALLVIVSWTSFIIKPDVVPGRLGLLVTIFLVLINIFNGAKSNAPTSGILNAVDLYLVVCIGQVFIALVEYAIVLVLEKRTIKVAPSPGCKSINQNISETMDTNIVARNSWIEQQSTTSSNLDSISLIIFPIFFTIFIIIYCIIYCNFLL